MFSRRPRRGDFHSAVQCQLEDDPWRERLLVLSEPVALKGVKPTVPLQHLADRHADASDEGMRRDVTSCARDPFALICHLQYVFEQSECTCVERL